MKRMFMVALFLSVSFIVFGQNLVTNGDFVLRGTVLAGYTGRAADLTIPDNLGITEIGSSCFSHTRINSVIIPKGVLRIGKNAFSSAYSLTSITLPDSLIVIDDEAFLGCGSLVRITIPTSIVAIGSDAFRNCSKLIMINMPANVTYISSTAISNGLAAAYDNAGKKSGTYTYVRGFNTWRFGTEPVHQAQFVSPGDSIGGSFQNKRENWYYVTISMGGGMLTSFTEGDLDTYMTIYDSNGNEMEHDDDSGEENNAKINAILTEGMFYIKVYGRSSSREGYTLKVLFEPL